MGGKNRGNDFTRDPCPYSITYDVGIGFGLGATLGILVNTYKGYRHSPRGERWRGIVSGVKTRAPILAGNFAVWSGVFNAFDCAFVSIRHKEDAWNSIMAGFSTGAILAVRSGPTVMLLSGAMGGFFLAAMEGAGVMFGKMMGGNIDPQPIVLPESIKNPPPQKSQEKDEKFQNTDHNDTPISSLFKGKKFGF